MEVLMKRARDVDVSFRAPPSKSFTHRALIAAGLATGDSVIMNPLSSEDTLMTVRGLGTLGIGISFSGGNITVNGAGGCPDCGDRCIIDTGNSGTSLRLLASVALLSAHPVLLTGSRRMQERPVGPLVEALRSLGAGIGYLGNPGYPPVVIRGSLAGGKVAVDAAMSSQFVSSILIAAPYAGREVSISIPGTVSSRSYIDVTLDVMEQFGAVYSRNGYREFRVRNDRRYRGTRYTIEGDYSSASYFFAVAAVTEGRVTVTGLNPASVQGDRAFLDALGEMGCTVRTGKESVTVESSGRLEGIDIDMSSSPDTVQTLCMVAALAKGKTRISGISHLRFKESDRIGTMADLLGNLGGNVSVGEDELVISPAPLHGGRIPTHDDHRIAMSFAVLGLGTGDLAIEDAGCTAKSFPGFWDALREAGLCG